MKTLFRVLVILVAASIIGGLMYAGVSASGSSTANFEEGEGRPQLPEGAEFRPDGEREEREGGFGVPTGIVKAVGLMSLAGGVYSAIVWTGKKAKRTAAA
jgi:hypothetical protein